MKTIKELYDSTNGKLPLAVRSKFWAKDTYAIIIQLGPSTANMKTHEDMMSSIDLLFAPVGLCITDNRPNTIFYDDENFRKYSVIPRSDKSEWQLVGNIDITRFERVNIHGLHNILYFGKYTGREIKDIINKDKSYLFWAIKNTGEFALGDDVIKYLKDNFVDIDDSIYELNKEKIIYIQTQLSTR